MTARKLKENDGTCKAKFQLVLKGIAPGRLKDASMWRLYVVRDEGKGLANNKSLISRLSPQDDIVL